MGFQKLIKVLVLVIGLNFCFVSESKAMDPRARVMLSVTGYGVAAGTLLGIASLAFGTEVRAIAVGASLGLYAGIVFGSYIVLSHQYSKANPDTDLYPETDGPYQLEEGSTEYYWQELQAESLTEDLQPKGFNFKRETAPPLYLNLLNISF